jgi:hypothetical protein
MLHVLTQTVSLISKQLSHIPRDNEIPQISYTSCQRDSDSTQTCVSSDVPSPKELCPFFHFLFVSCHACIWPFNRSKWGLAIRTWGSSVISASSSYIYIQLNCMLHGRDGSLSIWYWAYIPVSPSELGIEARTVLIQYNARKALLLPSDRVYSDSAHPDKHNQPAGPGLWRGEWRM